MKAGLKFFRSLEAPTNWIDLPSGDRVAHNFHKQGAAVDLGVHIVNAISGEYLSEHQERFLNMFAEMIPTVESTFAPLREAVGRAGKGLNLLGRYAMLNTTALGHLRNKEYDKALVVFDTMIHLALYKMNMPLSWIKPVQNLRLHCFRRIRENAELKHHEVPT